VTLDLTDEERVILKRACRSNPMNVWDIVGLRMAILKLQAGKMKAEFVLQHEDCQITDDARWWCQSEMEFWGHTWTDEQWLEAAKQVIADTEGK